MVRFAMLWSISHLLLIDICTPGFNLLAVLYAKQISKWSGSMCCQSCLWPILHMQTTTSYYKPLFSYTVFWRSTFSAQS